jgi:hypothetical protein
LAKCPRSAVVAELVPAVVPDSFHADQCVPLMLGYVSNSGRITLHPGGRTR